LHRFNDEHVYLPKASDQKSDAGPAVSWRVQVLPYSFGSENKAGQYDPERVWNDPHNLSLQDAGISRYAYWPIAGQRDALASAPYQYPFETKTYIKAIVGKGTAFDSDIRRSLTALPSDLVIIVRVEESDTHWMEPNDLDVEIASSPEGKRMLLGDNGYAVLFADGEAWWLSSEVPFEDLRKFFTIDGAENFDRDHLLAPYKLSWQANGSVQK
jgi:hypothetical protein